MMCGVGFAGSLFSGPVTSVYTGSDAIDTGNSVIVVPDDDLQGKYDWLKSSDRDTQMGPLSEVNPRYVILTPGGYSDDLIMDTENVHVYELAYKTVTYTGEITNNTSNGTFAIFMPKTRSMFPPVRDVSWALAFDDTASFTVLNGTASYDTGHWTRSFDNERSIKVTPTADNAILQNIFAADNAGQDWTNKLITLSFYLDPDNFSDATQVQFDWYSDGGTANGRQYLMWKDDVLQQSKLGWNQFSFHVDDYTALNGTGGDITDVTTIRMRVRCDSPFSAIVTWDGIEVSSNPMTKGFVIPRIDDGREAQKAVMAYMVSKGLPGIIGITPKYIDQPGGMTSEEVTRWMKAGILPVNHYFYDVDLTTQTKAEIVDGVEKTAQWMESRGWGSGARVFMLPQGFMDADVLDACRERVDMFLIAHGNLIKTEGSTTGLDPWYIGAVNAQLSSKTSVIDDARDWNGILAVYTHDDTASFRANLDYIASQWAAGNINVGTPLDILNLKHLD
jgi:hypothetical protein